MYYLRNLKDDKLYYYCRHCGKEEYNLSQNNFKVFKYDSETKIKNKSINEYTKYDPTLPHLTSIKCPNESCSTNRSDNPDKPDVLYIRYDDKNMSYMYMCCLCDFSWKA
tara:strand:- start:2036 stop:2362 length:327 start_codon:yes stop_codon:yes gene_type:complete